MLQRNVACSCQGQRQGSTLVGTPSDRVNPSRHSIYYFRPAADPVSKRSCILPVLAVIFLMLTACRDPGIIPRQDPDPEYLNGQKPRYGRQTADGAAADTAMWLAGLMKR